MNDDAAAPEGADPLPGQTAGRPAATDASEPAAEPRPDPVAPAIAVAVTPPVTHATKVKIETPGATVEIEAQAGLDEVARVALQLFRQAGGWPQENVHSAGFASAERRDSPPVQPSGMFSAPGSYPVQYP